MEAPLLFESGLNNLCDETIFIDITEETQIKHLKMRKSDVESSLKLNRSFNPENKKKATIIINNDNTVADLENQLNTIFCK